MRNYLSEAMNQISDAHISEAALARRNRRPYWLGAVAAVLAVVLLFQAGNLPMAVQANAISLVPESRAATRPDLDDYEDSDAWRTDWDQYQQQKTLRKSEINQVASTLTPFFQEASRLVLAENSDSNSVWSPVNAYIGLAMAAELTSGTSQQQILNLLGAEDVDTLRQQVSTVWEEIDRDDGHEVCVLANSLWLDNGLHYRQDAMDALSYHYYASIYQGNLGSSKTNRAISSWLSNNTGGLLRNATERIQLPEETVLALYSTIFFQSKWSHQFSSFANTQAAFHAPQGDVTCTFMNQQQQTDYYWGEDFGAVALSLKNGSQMWFFLPDEDKDVSQLLQSSQYLECVTNPDAYAETNGKYMKVNLSVPKFDISSSINLQSCLETLGVTDVFAPGAADFTQILTGTSVYLTAANQATRVTIDEDGVKAATYIEFPGAGAAAPPDEIIDFILDRPFVFVIAKENLPLFTGVVNCPS